MQKLHSILLWCFAINYQVQYLPHWSQIPLPFFSSFLVLFEQITTLISDTFLINIKLNFWNFVLSNGTPCISTFFRFWVILIRFYQKYFSAQVNIMFVSPSQRGAKKENKIYKNLNTKSWSHWQLFQKEFGVHEQCWLIETEKNRKAFLILWLPEQKGWWFLPINREKDDFLPHYSCCCTIGNLIS